jgi:hypothetical protein
MNLLKLNDIMPYKWRVQSFSKFKAQGQCVAYIDARDVQKRLDSVCGKENWQDLYYEVGSMLFCKIGIKVGGEWVWKSDTGSESNMEKEKGHSSDAFKRTAVMWGVGRFLYDMKIRNVTANEKKTKSNWPYVVDDKGKKVWDLTNHIHAKGAPRIIQEEYLKKMRGFAKHDPDIYKAVLKAWQVESAKNITHPDPQFALLDDLQDKLKDES